MESALWMEKHLNYYAKLVGLEPLRLEKVCGDDLSVRVWLDFHGLRRGYLIKRLDEDWNGEAITWERDEPAIRPLKPSGVNIFGPSNTWNQIGELLLYQDLLTLPDSHTLPKINQNIAQLGGGFLMVEIKTSQGYRNYSYNLNPSKEIYDFNNPFVVEAFLSADNLKNILLHCLEVQKD
jgi:hypothetical protein